MPGKTMSSTYRAAPVTLPRPSLRGTGAPTMWCSCNFANVTLSLDKSDSCAVTVESASNGNCHWDIVIADAYKWFCEQYSEANSERFKYLCELSIDLLALKFAPGRFSWILDLSEY